MLAAPITNTVMCAPGPSTTPNWYTHNNTTVHLSQPTQLSTSICGPAGHSYRSAAAAEAEQPTKVAWAQAGGTSVFVSVQSWPCLHYRLAAASVSRGIVIGSLLIAELSEAVAMSVAAAWGLGLHTPQHNRQSSCSAHPK